MRQQPGLHSAAHVGGDRCVARGASGTPGHPARSAGHLERSRLHVAAHHSRASVLPAAPAAGTLDLLRRGHRAHRLAPFLEAGAVDPRQDAGKTAFHPAARPHSHFREAHRPHDGSRAAPTLELPGRVDPAASSLRSDDLRERALSPAPAARALEQRSARARHRPARRRDARAGRPRRHPGFYHLRHNARRLRRHLPREAPPRSKRCGNGSPVFRQAIERAA